MPDYYYSSWGYDQTNIDFYQVVKRTAATITLQPVKSECLSGGWGGGVVVPIIEPDGEPLRRKLSGKCASVKIKSYVYAYPWDGRPKDFTSYA